MNIVCIKTLDCLEHTGDHLALMSMSMSTSAQIFSMVDAS
jgi:hypothetical protein